MLIRDFNHSPTCFCHPCARPGVASPDRIKCPVADMVRDA